MTAPPATNGAVTKRSRFADGSADRLPLSDGDWVLVRRELTFGQQRRLAAAGLTGIDTAAPTGERLRVDLAAFDIEKLVTWVMDWSFTDEDGTHLDVSRERIEALTPETAREITEALDAHIEAQEGKKGPAATGSPKPAATSSSANASAGAGRS
jgi:hypothetical protein